MKRRRSGASTSQTTRLISQRSSANPAVTLVKLEDPGSCLPVSDTRGDSEPVPVPLPRASTARRSKRIKVEELAEGNNDDAELSVLAPESLPTSKGSKGKGKKVVERPPTLAPPSRSATASPQKQKAIKQVLEKPHPAPARWQETYDAIKEMRARFPAPVDTMGCDTAKWKETDPRNKRLATLISLMLSSQTKDEVTDAAVDKLRAALGGTLSLDALLAAEEHVIASTINKVGFWRRKTQYIRQAAQRLRDDFDSDVPKTVDELCSLPGVGPKMAFLCLHAAWDINVGIGVDVHVQRITNRLQWHKPPTKTPEETRLNLQSWLPTEFHKEINHLLVGFGQVICLPVGPRCDLCTLSREKICPSASQMVGKSRIKRAPAATAVKSETGGPKIEIAFEEDVAVTIPNLPKGEPASPCLSAASSLTPEPEEA